MTTGDVVYSLRFFTHQNAKPEPKFKLRSTAGESSMLTARLHMLIGSLMICFPLCKYRKKNFSGIWNEIWLDYSNRTIPTDLLGVVDV